MEAPANITANTSKIIFKIFTRALVQWLHDALNLKYQVDT